MRLRGEADRRFLAIGIAKEDLGSIEAATKEGTMDLNLIARIRPLLCRRAGRQLTANSPLVLAAFFGMVTVFPVEAAETVVPVTPPGGTDLSQALLPPPGLYGAVFSLPFNQNGQLYGYDEKPVAPQQNVKLSVPVLGAALAYVYPFEVWGGKLASSVVMSFWDMNYQIGQNSPEGHQFGLADTYSDIIFWSKYVGLMGSTPGNLPLPYGLTIGAGYAMKFPTGGYSLSNPVNVGSNLWLAIPNVAATYITGPNMSLGDSTEISARLFYGIPFRNSATGYTSGNVMDIDWSVAERFGAFRVGVTGSYQAQVSDDTMLGGLPVVNGGKFANACIGPIFAYVIPDTSIELKLKYQKFFFEKNFTDTQVIAVSISGKLY